MQVAKRILKSFKATVGFDLFYGKEGNEELIAYTNSDYNDDIDNKKNISVNVFILNSRAVSWFEEETTCSLLFHYVLKVIFVIVIF